MSKYTEWEDRKKGFDFLVNNVTNKKTDGELTEPSSQTHQDPTIEDLGKLVDSLSAFTKELYDFFLNGFREFLGFVQAVDNSPTGYERIKLITSAEYPPEYVLQKILQQASFDLTVIQRCIEQRSNEDLLPRLKKYDQLALSALSIAFPNPENNATWLIDPVKPFVYFQRDTSVRIIPYANALLIGVPYSANKQPIDLLSIPHEVGHHVYETGRFSSQEPINLYFEKCFAGQPEWIKNWLEEIFADLYGFLVAGPIIGFSLQEILLDNLPSDLCQDDGDHPSGIVRPLIYSKLFSELNAQKTSDKLTEKWDEEGKKRGFAKKFKPCKETDFIERDEASKILSEVMYEMYKCINEETAGGFEFPEGPIINNKNLSLHPWTFFPSPGHQWPHINHEKVFDDFGNFLNLYQEQPQEPMETQLKNMGEVNKDFNLSREDKYAYWLTNQIKYWNEEKNKVPPLQPNIWKLIFTAFNWADQPDDTRPVHGPENLRY